eukprot:Nk52_evm31s210 gene=Nk52_evmTU31s210
MTVNGAFKQSKGGGGEDGGSDVGTIGVPEVNADQTKCEKRLGKDKGEDAGDGGCGSVCSGTDEAALNSRHPWYLRKKPHRSFVGMKWRSINEILRDHKQNKQAEKKHQQLVQGFLDRSSVNNGGGDAEKKSQEVYDAGGSIPLTPKGPARNVQMGCLLNGGKRGEKEEEEEEGEEYGDDEDEDEEYEDEEYEGEEYEEEQETKTGLSWNSLVDKRLKEVRHQRKLRREADLEKAKVALKKHTVLTQSDYLLWENPVKATKKNKKNKLEAHLEEGNEEEQGKEKGEGGKGMNKKSAHPSWKQMPNKKNRKGKAVNLFSKERSQTFLKLAEDEAKIISSRSNAYNLLSSMERSQQGKITSALFKRSDSLVASGGEEQPEEGHGNTPTSSTGSLNAHPSAAKIPSAVIMKENAPTSGFKSQEWKKSLNSIQEIRRDSSLEATTMAIQERKRFLTFQKDSLAQKYGTFFKSVPTRGSESNDNPNSGHESNSNSIGLKEEPQSPINTHQTLSKAMHSAHAVKREAAEKNRGVVEIALNASTHAMRAAHTNSSLARAAHTQKVLKRQEEIEAHQNSLRHMQENHQHHSQHKHGHQQRHHHRHHHGHHHHHHHRHHRHHRHHHHHHGTRDGKGRGRLDEAKGADKAGVNELLEQDNFRHRRKQDMIQYQRHLQTHSLHSKRRVMAIYPDGHSNYTQSDEEDREEEDDIFEALEGEMYSKGSGKSSKAKLNKVNEMANSKRNVNEVQGSTRGLRKRSIGSSTAQMMGASDSMDNHGSEESDSGSESSSSYSSSSSESSIDIDNEVLKHPQKPHIEDDEPDWTLVETFNLVNDFQAFLDSYHNPDEDYLNNENRPKLDPQEVIKAMKSDRLGMVNTKPISITLVKEPPQELIKSHTVTKFSKLNDHKLPTQIIKGSSVNTVKKTSPHSPDIKVLKPPTSKRKPIYGAWYLRRELWKPREFGTPLKNPEILKTQDGREKDASRRHQLLENMLYKLPSSAVYKAFLERQGWTIPEFLKSIESVDTFQTVRAKKAAAAAKAMGIMSFQATGRQFGSQTRSITRSQQSLK